MTVRVRANSSRNGTQRGRPPKPARKPSFGPLPLVQTRQGKPFTSTVVVAGSDKVYSAATVWGRKAGTAARCPFAIGLGHHLSSQSENRSLTCGITFSANIRVLYLVVSL